MRRLATFRAYSWTLDDISPVTLACHGWINDSLDTMICESCLVVVNKQQVSASKDDASMLMLWHDEGCGWRNLKCQGDVLYKLPFHSEKDRHMHFETAKLKLKSDVDLTCLRIAGSDCSLETDVKAEILARHGWVSVNTKKPLQCIECPVCFRFVGLWNFNEVDDFDPKSEHRIYCLFR
jgi:hypothetical protein